MVALLLSYRNQKRQLALERENAALQERSHQASSLDEKIETSLLSLSQRALQSSSAHLMQLTKAELDAQQGWLEQTTALVSSRLREIDQAIKSMEASRAAREGALGEQLTSLAAITGDLSSHTRHLHRTLSAPRGAGRWGEMQLRNVIEHVGLLSFVDFSEQSSVSRNSEDPLVPHSTTQRSETLRPDLVIRLPGDRRLVVDSKAPVQGLLSIPPDADEATERNACKQFAAALKRHIRTTSQRNYPRAIPGALPQVVVFVPSEPLLGIALDAEPDMLQYCQEYQILLCTPLSLVAYLHTVAIDWREANLRVHAEELKALGLSLFENLDTVMGSLNGVGRSLSSAVTQFNDACRTIDRTVLPLSDRFHQIESDSAAALSETRGVASVNTLVRELPLKTSTTLTD